MLIDSVKAIRGRLVNTRTFTEAGDEQTMHTHPPGQEHLTFVRSGTFYVYGPGTPPKWERTLGPGDMIDFEADKPHAIRALTAGARLTNVGI